MSDYVTTNCIRLKTNFTSMKEILDNINVKINFADIHDEDCLYEINEQIKSHDIRVVHYEECYYIDIILYNEWSDGIEPDFYMSLKEIKSKIKEYKNIFKFKPVDIIILSHQWYNGCEEPYT